MPVVSSSLGTTQPYIPLINVTELQKAAGLYIQFPTIGDLVAAVGATSPVASGERANILRGQRLWRANQPISVSTEPAGVRRIWTVGASAELSHARGVVLPSGVVVPLIFDASTVIPTSSAPSTSTGNVGDMAVDFANGTYYIKSDFSTWGNALPIGPAPTGALTITGLASWVSGRAYAVGEEVIAPNSKVATSRVGHTSASFFDARNWTFPSDDGATLFDFSQLSDGPINEICPTKGHFYHFGVASTEWPKWVVKDGFFQANPTNPPGTVVYFEGSLSNSSLKVQHMWCVADVAANPIPNNGITFVWNTIDTTDPNAGSAINAGIHWGMLPAIQNGSDPIDYGGLWGAEPYPTSPNFGNVSSGPTHIPVQQPRGRTMRWDITVDRVTGTMKGFIDGKLVMQYTDIDIIDAIKSRAIFEIAETNFKVREFGLSPHMPVWAIDGTARSLRLTGNDNTSITSLTGSYQRLHQFTVGYDSGGAISVDWSPFVNCSSGQVFMELGPADQTEFTAFVATLLPQIVAEANTNCRVAFAGWQRGIPGTTKSLGIWARTTGVATVRQDTYGNNVGGPRWSPAVFRSSVNPST